MHITKLRIPRKRRRPNPESFPRLEEKNNIMETININRFSQRLLTAIVSIIVLFGCIYAGRTELNDQVLSGMSDTKFEFIQQSIGGGSPSDVVKEYLSRQSYYDTVHITSK